MNFQVLYILCGYPFAGKSTLTKELIDQFGFSLVGIDEINRERGVGQSTGVAVTPEEWDKTYRQAYKRIEQLLGKGKSVIYDATNFTKEQRDIPRKIAQKYNVATKLLFVDVPKEIVYQRLQENRKTNSRFDVKDEDFAQVVDNFQKPSDDENVLIFDGSIPMVDWILQVIH